MILLHRRGRGRTPAWRTSLARLAVTLSNPVLVGDTDIAGSAAVLVGARAEGTSRAVAADSICRRGRFHNHLGASRTRAALLASLHPVFVLIRHAEIAFAARGTVLRRGEGSRHARAADYVRGRRACHNNHEPRPADVRRRAVCLAGPTLKPGVGTSLTHAALWRWGKFARLA